MMSLKTKKADNQSVKTDNNSGYSPMKDFLNQFLKQKVGVVSFFIVIAIILLSFIAPYIVPYDPSRPVTSQYKEKGIVLEQVTNLVTEYTVEKNIESDKKIFLRPQVESGDRRTAMGRWVRDGVKITAVNPGQTYIVFKLGDVSTAVKVNVSRLNGYQILTQLQTNSPEKSLEVGDNFDIQLTGLLSNGKEISDHDQIESTVKKMLDVKDNSSTGGYNYGPSPKAEIQYKSLTPEIVQVNDDGLVEAVAKGTGKVKVTCGEISSVVPVPVGVEKPEVVVTGVHFNKSMVGLADIYKHQLPSKRHWFGTDHQNRDIFSRVLVGTRATLIIGFVSVFIGSSIGTLLGLLAGYYGGWIDNLLNRFCEILLAFPGILLAIAVIAVLGPGLHNIIFAVAVFTVPIFIRIVRGSTMELKNKTYVEAAKALGVRDIVIILKHIFPGALSIVMVYLTMRIGYAIIIGASLSFLGLGGDITAPEWGAMLSAAKDNSRNFFHTMFFPGLAIVITVLAFNLLGDALRDALDPKIND